MGKVTCQLAVYPDYLHDEMGLDFSERFHTDPVYRNEKWKEVVRWVNGRFGCWGCGAANPADSYLVTTLDPVHLTSYLFGSKVHYYSRNHPDTHDYPLVNIASLNDFNRHDEQAQSKFNEILDLGRRLVDTYGPENVGIPYYASQLLGMEDMEVPHCPLTISYRLFGNRIFYEMYDNPEGIQHAFREIMLLSREIAEAFRDLVGKPRPKSAGQGACATVMIGPEQFKQYLLPVVLEHTDGRPLLWHCCGNVNGLFEAFQELSASVPVKVFDCREQAKIDIELAAKTFPEAVISYMMSPPAALTRTPDEMRQAVCSAVERAGDSAIHLILNLPSGVEDKVVDAFFETCVELGAELSGEAGFSFA